MVRFDCGGAMVQQHERVILDLSADHFHEVEQGWFVGPDGHHYSRRTTRTKRKEADRLVAEGVPLVLYYWAEGQLDWRDGADAREEWQIVRPYVVTNEPSGKGDIEWTVGRWENEEGRLVLVLTGHC